ncbi:TonB-dependent receptor [Candidatus Sulfidibacterium hydrothermale]|uniref:TonB-dependent receptor n=1 Tax=Candidatus Sulfidibacterium hydrothermale TaxID=2875962 RepID=UPI001F0B134A|nr:TonB-dependent receptor [Candidatus Sulfidibacterium hydrothermale]UBM61449.1 TonB-dependent receptor [Candidatus Sulfidibacterium hydrothermale]
MKHDIIPTARKALQINLDTDFYGSFAEIGGGQEVARQFFVAGGASGTVAKTISAYDKRFSDARYNDNKPGRYVSEERLMKMLRKEYHEVEKLLSEKYTARTFFAFADTVEILNYSKTNYAHGWMGVKFQLHPGGRSNTVVLHVKLLENDGVMQQTTLGILGVNLLYACKNFYDDPSRFLISLMDNLSPDRFCISALRMSGPDLDYVDNRLLAIQLVQNGMAHAMMFDKKGNVQQPSDMLYKKNVLAFRGSFRPVTYVVKDILRQSIELFQKDESYEPDNTLSFCEITLNNLLTEGEEDSRDFLERIDMLNAIGQNVMISDFKEYFKLVDFFSQFKLKNLRIVMGVPTLEKVMDKRYYENLKGGILQALGLLFPKNTKLYIYPTLKKEENKKYLITSKDIFLSSDIRLLFGYLIENRLILDLGSELPEHLFVKSREVLKMIQERNPEWERYVPMDISKIIKAKGLFVKN